MTIPALLWVILWTNVVVKGRNKICLDLKTTMMLWRRFLLNHEKVYFKLIMKKYWLLGVENDEAIVRNGCEKEDLKIWKKQFFISWYSMFYLMKYESILSKLPRVSEVTTNHWVFLAVIGHLTLFHFITNPKLRKRSFFLI